MRKVLLGTILTTILASPATMVTAAEEAAAEKAAVAEDISVHVQESRALTKKLFVKLKHALVTGMKAGGPSTAITACNVQAQPITKAASKRRTGLNIRRTSLRLRNPKNAPDAWEIRVLEQFEARFSAGEDPSQVEYHEVVEQPGDGRLFRYMKAIPASKPCMVCHGELVAPDVLKTIRDLYPYEQATGFKPGDLRGAFSVTRELD